MDRLGYFGRCCCSGFYLQALAVKIYLYSTVGCHLCEHAKAIL
ncbi:MAG: hypothetical protein EOO68_38630, partial [Moraxellaceae bacterium]